MPNSDFTTGPPITEITVPRPKIEFFKIVRNHFGPIQEHPGGVLDDIGAVFRTPGSRSVLVRLVKRRIRQF